jgi:hypothetical protein
MEHFGTGSRIFTTENTERTEKSNYSSDYCVWQQSGVEVNQQAYAKPLKRR